ncbi:MAG: sensor histidine kinase [Chloroflexota bacterium]
MTRKPSSSKTQNAVAIDATLESALQEERSRIAREIHDGVSQSLALLILKMEMISRLADSDPPRVKAELQKAMSILETSVQELRQLIDTLLPPSSPQKP